jgi:Rad3-related DNA helicase
MLDEQQYGKIGDNKPPTPMEVFADENENLITQCQHLIWGGAITNESQLKSLDVAIKEFKKYSSALTKIGKDFSKPLHTKWKDAVNYANIYIEDANLIKSHLVEIGKPLRERLQKEQEEKTWLALEETRKKQRLADEAAKLAEAGTIDQKREALKLNQEALDADKAAKATSKNKVLGLRKVTKFEVTNAQDALIWIGENDKEALIQFISEYARINHKKHAIDGVNVWEEKEAF